MSWYLFKLVNENALVRTGRGMYAKVMKQSFVPKLIGEVREIYDSLLVNFPFAKFCVYQGDIIATLQHHLSSNRVVYVETDRDSAETVFNFLKDGNRDVYLRPDKDMIYRYVDMDSRVFFVKNLVSEAPLQKVSDVPMPTLEKRISSTYKAVKASISLKMPLICTLSIEIGYSGMPADVRQKKKYCPY